MEDLSVENQQNNPQKKDFWQSIGKIVTKQHQAPPIVSVSRDRPLPLSFAQERLWFLQQLEPESITYQVTGAYPLVNNINVPALEQSFNELQKRHEILRTTFPIIDGNPVQLISPPNKIDLSVLNLQELPQEERKTQREIYLDRQTKKPFKLTEEFPWRAQILQLEETEYILILSMHHIMYDGSCLGIFFQELHQIYDAFINHRPSPLTEIKLQYADFAHWQRQWLQGEVLASQIAYWQKQLGGNLPVLQLPSDRPRQTGKSDLVVQEPLSIDSDLTKKLKFLSEKSGATLFMTILAAFKVLIYRYTGQEDILIGTPIANRNRHELQKIIGFFVNTLVLRNNLSGNPSFRELLNRVKETCLQAYTHQDTPFELLVQKLHPTRNLSENSLFQVWFNMVNLSFKNELEPPASNIFKEESESSLVSPKFSQFNFSLYVYEQDCNLEFYLTYKVELFARERVIEMGKQFEYLLEQIVNNCEKKIDNFCLITPQQRNILPNPLESLETNYEKVFHSHFSQKAQEYSQSLAVVDKQVSWNYQQLETRSNQLANYLIDKGIKKENVIAIYGDRSVSLVWAMLGVIKAGAAFLIIDPAYPASSLIERLSLASIDGWIEIEQQIEVVSSIKQFIDNLSLCVSIELSAQSDFKDYCTEAPKISIYPENLAYVAFTSGSTGKPKGILGTHKPLSHFLDWHCHKFSLKETDRFIMLSGLSHDPLLRDIFTPLWLGATLYIPSKQEMENPDLLINFIAKNNITVLHLTPAMGNFLSTNNIELNLKVRYVFFAGDILKKEHVETIKNLAPEANYINFYGATETPQAMGYFEIFNSLDLTPNNIPLGKGIKDVQLLILNRSEHICGIGEMGEIYVRTPYLSKGYLEDEQLTQEKFIPNPFNPSERLYKTGDLARYLADGNIEFLGRIDNQIKIRGFRIEPGEIETILKQHPDIEESIVLARENPSQDKYLVAYIVANQKQVPTLEQLRLFLAQKLPNYMIPSALILVEAMPLTPNGKIDRQALSQLDIVRQTPTNNFVAPRNLIEQKLANIWQRVLWLEQEIGIHDNFFDLGGHSLLAVRLVNEIETVFNRQLPLKALFQLSTIAEIAKILEEEDTQLATTIPSLNVLQLAPEIYHQLLAYTAGWQGERIKSDSFSLIVGINTKGTKQPIFWCLQGFRELSQLGKYLGEEQPIYGMRSGHLFMEYTPSNIKALAYYYVQEILTIQSEGSYLLGGNCQAGNIIWEISRQLLLEGKHITLLCLLDKFMPIAYPGKIAFFFGRDSFINPYKYFHQPELGWHKLYPTGFSLNLLPACHGQYFNEPTIQIFAKKLQEEITKAQQEANNQQILNKSAYQAQIQTIESLIATSGTTVTLTVKVKNISPITWYSTEKSAIALGNHWLNAQGEIIYWNDGKANLIEDLSSGEEVELFLSVTIPLEAGNYFLELDLMEEGITWFAQKGSQTAIIKLEAIAPKNIDTHSLEKEEEYLNLARVQFNKGDMIKASFYYQKLIELNPHQSIEIYQNLAHAWKEQEQIERAISIYEQAIKIQPDNPDLYYQLGKIYQEQKNWHLAQINFEKTINLTPQYLGVYENLGNIYQQLGNLEKAIIAYEQELKFQPNFANLYVQLSQVQIKQGQLSQAIVNSQKALEIKPDNLGIYNQIGNIYRQEKQLETALIFYQKALNLNAQHWPTYRNIGDTYNEAGELEKALASYQQAIQINSNNPVLYRILGNVQFKLNNLEEAIASYEKTINLEPENPLNYRSLANVQMKKRDFQSAIFSWNCAIKIDTKHGAQYLNLGNCFKQLGNLSDAIASYQQGLELEPNNPLLLLNLGDVQRQQGNLETAIINYQKAINFQHSQPCPIYIRLGDIFTQLHRVNEAIAAYEEALKINPNHPHIPRYLALVKEKKKNRKVICILGMHRSGTSCLAGCLQASGLFFGGVEDWNTDNLKGNRENLTIRKLNEFILTVNDASWDKPPQTIIYSSEHREKRDMLVNNLFAQNSVWMFKDPRTLLLLSFWQEGIENLNFIGTFRHPLKVAMSLYERNTIPIRDGLNLWLEYNNLLLTAFEEKSFPLICFDLEEEKYLDNIARIITILNREIIQEKSLSIEAAKEFYEHQLQHQPDFIPFTNSNSDDERLIVQAEEVYQTLRKAAGLSEAPTSQSGYFVPLNQEINSYEKILELQPANPYIYLMLANIQSQQEDFTSAITNYQKAINLNIATVSIYKAIGNCFQQQGDAEKAIAILENALTLQPENANTYLALAHTLREQNNLSAAIVNYQKAIESLSTYQAIDVDNPQYFTAYKNLGDIFLLQGDLESSIENYQKAIAIKPENPFIYRLLGNTQLKKEDLDAAILSYEKAINLESENPLNYRSLANVQLRKRDFHASIVSWNCAIKLEPNQCGQYLNLGHCFKQLGNFKDAYTSYQQGLELEPNHPLLLLNLGDIQRQQGDLESAIINYRKALDFNHPQPCPIYIRLGDIFKQLHRLDEAIDAYQQALKINPNHPHALRYLPLLK